MGGRRSDIGQYLPPTKAEEMASDAGFTRFRQLDIDHATNAFYEIRP